MKTFLLVLFFISFGNISFAQNNNVRLSYLTDCNIQFATEQVGYAYFYSLFYKTLNGGMNWEKIYTESTNTILALSFIDENIGYIVKKELPELGLYKTINGGVTFTKISSIAEQGTFSMKFISENKGVIVFVENAVSYVTTDDGKTWKKRSAPEAVKNSNITILNENTFFASCYSQATRQADLLRTENGGDTWENIKTFKEYHIRATQFVDRNIGFICHLPYMSKTTDGGITWETNSIDNLVSGSSYGPITFRFFDSKNGIMIADEYGSIFKLFETNDGGITWRKKLFSSPSINNSTINRIFFLNRNVGFMIGDIGDFYVTKDGGNSWQVYYEQDKILYLNSICKINSKEAITVGSEGYCVINSASGEEPIDLKTKETLISVVFTDSLKGVIISEQGSIFYSEDSGRTWIKKLTDANGFKDLTCNDSICMAVGGNATIYLSENSGSSWKKITYNDPDVVGYTKVMHFDKCAIVNKDTIIAAGTQNYEWPDGMFSSNLRIIRSVDNGKTWVKSSYKLSAPGGGNLFALKFLGNRELYMVFMNRIHRSKDYGLTWTEGGEDYNLPRKLKEQEDGTLIGLIGDWDNYIKKSKDFGYTWETIKVFDYQDRINDFVITENYTYFIRDKVILLPLEVITLSKTEITTSVISLPNESVKIYPNPTNGHISIESAVPYTGVSLYSLAGIKVGSYENASEMDLTSINAGIYMIVLHHLNGKTTSVKLVLTE